MLLASLFQNAYIKMVTSQKRIMMSFKLNIKQKWRVTSSNRKIKKFSVILATSNLLGFVNKVDQSQVGISALPRVK